jgi:hypothetical protein
MSAQIDPYSPPAGRKAELLRWLTVPVSGGWGQRGSTNVRLAAADETTIQSAVAMAWQNKAPKQLVNKQNKRRIQ